MNYKVRIIGDCHGAINKFRPSTIEAQCHDRNYIKLIQDCDYSVQIGDLGFDYSPIKHLRPDKHAFIGGNHDNYWDLPSIYLGDFGLHNFEEFQFFFIRGALSIDKDYRYHSGPDKSWWEEEELTHKQMEDCLDYYEQKKPDIVIAHDCPQKLLGKIVKSSFKMISSSRTSKFFDRLHEIHKPKYWIHGHHHQNYRRKLFDDDVTEFIGVSELCYLDWTEEKGFEGPY